MLRARRVSAGNPLSVPRGAARRPTPVYDPDAFGRFSEAIARFLGTGKFLAGQTVVVAVWIALNTIGILHHWDPYPFILLNLGFSTQAAYAAPLILLAQNRQDERERLSIERDREVAARTQADTEYLARELTALRLSVADTVTTEDLDHVLERIETAIARLDERVAGLVPPAGSTPETPPAGSAPETAPGGSQTAPGRSRAGDEGSGGGHSVDGRDG